MRNRSTYPIRLILALACLVFAMPLAGQPVAPDELRVALIIGNGRYLNNTTLRNPPNDASDMAAALKSTGFSVTLLVNASRDAMEKAIRNFGASLKDPRAVGLFYYSGHGAQNAGQNYLLPVDADIQDADELRYKAVDAESVLAKMRSSGNRLNLMILDACRNNPFPGASRSADRGLSVVSIEVPESVIVYATSPGSVAQDGNDRNSPFTQAFLEGMRIPGMDIAMMMKQVTASVKRSTDGGQTPWISSNLTRDFAFVPTASPAAAIAPPKYATPDELLTGTWNVDLASRPSGWGDSKYVFRLDRRLEIWHGLKLHYRGMVRAVDEVSITVQPDFISTGAPLDPMVMCYTLSADGKHMKLGWYDGNKSPVYYLTLDRND